MSYQQEHQQHQAQQLEFRWLFIATFDDGSVIEQTPEDKSVLEPATRSAWYDVMQRLEAGHKLKQLDLCHVNGKEIVTVDMHTGAIIINGTPFNAHHEQQFDPATAELQPILFHETKRRQTITGTVQDDLSVKSEISSTEGFINRYFIGWQEVGGSNKALIAVG